MLPLYLCVVTAVELAFLLFHMSVTTFLLVQQNQRKRPFTSSFYTIYVLLSLADVVNYLMVGL